MGFIYNLVKRLLRLSIYVAILLTLIVVIPNLPPYTKFTSIKLEAPLPRVGGLAPNGDLNNAQRVYTGKLEGPETFQVHKGELYTSLATGEIVKISPGGHVTFVTKLGQPCTGLVQEHICGRPLGFVIDEKNDLMYVADAYLGIWKVNLKNDKKQLLVSPRVAIEGRTPKLFNCVTLSKKGDLYWTDSSSDFHLRDGAIATLTDPSGRLFHYNAATNQSKVLLDDLWFANGVVVSPDNQFVVISETSRLRLVKYYIEGPKKGQSEVFVAGLPGIPDNLRALPDGSGVLIALYCTYDDNNPLLLRSLSETPLVRKLLARIQRLVEIPIEYINTAFPHVIFEEILYNIGHFKTVAGMIPKMSGLVYVDWNGNIVSSHYNTDGSLGPISDAVLFNGRLHTGSPHLQKFIGSIEVPPVLKKTFEEGQKPVEAKVEKREAPKPVETPKPTTTTPRPTTTTTTPKPTTTTTTTPKPTTTTSTTTPKPTTTTTTTTPKPTTTTTTTTPKPTTTTQKPTTTTQKPTTTTPEPTAAPKPTTPPPADKKPPSPKPVEPKKEQPKPAPTQESKPSTPTPTQTPPKVQTTTTKPEVNPKQDTPEKAPKNKENAIPNSNKPSPEQIPIKEEIPSDTAKPVKENLKVIKKGGVPAEIPNPQL